MLARCSDRSSRCSRWSSRQNCLPRVCWILPTNLSIFGGRLATTFSLPLSLHEPPPQFNSTQIRHAPCRFGSSAFCQPFLRNPILQDTLLPSVVVVSMRREHCQNHHPRHPHFHHHHNHTAFVMSSAVIFSSACKMLGLSATRMLQWSDQSKHKKHLLCTKDHLHH